MWFTHLSLYGIAAFPALILVIIIIIEIWNQYFVFDVYTYITQAITDVLYKYIIYNNVTSSKLS